jgi:homopolymeric O-antigen transport system ATP-binding protein
LSSVAVKAESLSKLYRLGSGVQGRLTETLWNAMASPVARVRGRPRRKPETIWALRDVSLEIHEGEVVGIIGRNGAGKSTLLKVLSRITEPTSGYVDIRGRVGSLLEVGSGFHQDLTGRENVYLYGAILGMRRREVRRKFDEIVAFAEISDFIDTPVKRYSSGMYTRLAFAVAAHLEPEILIVDEVLAVGDIAFQKKCLGKMEDVAQGGRTVLFVSHNSAAVISLCQRAYLLEHGSVILEGKAKDVVHFYVDSVTANESTPLAERTDRDGDGSARIVSIRLSKAGGTGPITCGSPLEVELGYMSDQGPLRSPRFVLTVYDENYVGIFRLDTDAGGGIPPVLPPNGSVRCVTESIDLAPGKCRVNVSLFRGSVLSDFVEYATSFDVEPDDFFASGRIPSRDAALTLRRHTWSTDGHLVE